MDRSIDVTVSFISSIEILGTKFYEKKNQFSFDEEVARTLFFTVRTIDFYRSALQSIIRFSPIILQFHPIAFKFSTHEIFSLRREKKGRSFHCDQHRRRSCGQTASLFVSSARKVGIVCMRYRNVLYSYHNSNWP